MDAVYANCFGAPPGDLLLTEEIAVARSAPDALVVDRLIDADEAEALNVLVWRLAFTWGTIGGEDPSLVHGISAIDLAGAEGAITALVPAARGVLGMQSALRELIPARLLAAIPEEGAGHHIRIETLQARAALEAASSQLGPDFPVSVRGIRDPRNSTLAGKYARTRDIDQLAAIGGRGGRGTAERLVLRALNAAVRFRGVRASAVVLEYNPTRAFARRYASHRRAVALVRGHPDRRDLAAIAAAGDRVLVPPPTPRLSHPLVERRLREACATRETALNEAFTWAGVRLWPLLAEPLIDSAVRHAAYLDRAVPMLHRQLTRGRAVAVLVPFDTPPEARALVRTAQREGIVTLVLSDGFKADDFSPEGASTDIALSWSESMASHYFSRWPARRTIVTGNPRADSKRRRPTRAPRDQRPGRILIGSFTFSPVDLNCRRADPEVFIDEILSGIKASTRARGAHVVLKLHPADEPGHYREALERHRDLNVAIVTTGDVIDRFDECDVYVTTYSTSLIEAVQRGVPVIYYRVNEQRLHPPFSDDSLLSARTAARPVELSALLDGPLATEGGYGGYDLSAWAERYLGPADGRAVDRVAEVLEAFSSARSTFNSP
jgi:hypothetical protein